MVDVGGNRSRDAIVLTDDGIWGYQISIHPTSSPVTLRILAGGLLLMA
jgi:hypothetical protein